MVLDTQLLESLGPEDRPPGLTGRGGGVRACEPQGSYDVPGSEQLGSQLVGLRLLDIGASPFVTDGTVIKFGTNLPKKANKQRF